MIAPAARRRSSPCFAGGLGLAQAVALLAIVLLFGAVSLVPHQYWSPYYKVNFSPPASGIGVEAITVNGLPHQSIYPVSMLRRDNTFYLYPYRHLKGALGDVLIVGAGNGNDVAVALSKGARHIDAVEIDPVIQAIGARDHPDHPYQDPRVSVHIDDGRAFLERSDRRYDLIIFALPDSLTLVSGQSSLRLESYLFTLQAMQSVRRHLRAGGAFTMYNYYRPDVFDRYAETITRAFGHPPYIDRGPDSGGPRRQAVLTVGLAAGDVVGSTPWASPARPPTVATDDGRSPTSSPVRSLGSTWSRCCSSFWVAARHVASAGHSGRCDPISTCSSWAPRSVARDQERGAVRLALRDHLVRECARVLRHPPGRPLGRRGRQAPHSTPGEAALSAADGSAVVAWLVPPETLLAMPFVPRLAAAVGIAFAPVFLANLVFAQRFRDVGSSTVAFGANLVGARWAE